MSAFSRLQRASIGVGLMVLIGAIVPTTAWAQAAASGSIAGVAKDATGAVLPGVTVEAASPALIEKVRSAVTDGDGRYLIVELRPGTYTVTFSLVGFSTLKREGIELTTGFTATVNADMKVGALEETVTVSGASPVVDIRNVRTQTVLSRETLDLLPTAKTLGGFATLVVGATVVSSVIAAQDVGGNKGEQWGEILIHGGHSGDGRVTIDGMRYSMALGQAGGTNVFWRPNQAAVQEVALETSGMAAEAANGGLVINQVPKDGGNRFTIYAYGTGTNGNLQSDNLTQALRDRGLQSVTTVKRIHDVNGGVGGPILQNKLWFYAAARHTTAEQYYAGNYFNLNKPSSLGPGVALYTPDLSRQYFNYNNQRDTSLRLTWQAAPKHKITISESGQWACQCQLYPGLANQPAVPESSFSAVFSPLYLTQGTWSYPATNRLLFEAGWTWSVNGHSTEFVSGEDDISILETSTGLLYNAPAFGLGSTSRRAPGVANNYNQHNERFSVSYITGSHAFKVGLFTLFGTSEFKQSYVPHEVYYQFSNGVPISLTQWASPSYSLAQSREIAAYAQDQWAIQRLTLNLGVRIEQLKAWVPTQDRPAGRFTPVLHINEIDDVPNFTDITPRLGAAYDVFGNGKTALKVALGKYLEAQGPGYATNVNPANALVTNATRSWNDLTFPVGDPRRGNYVPDCVLENLALNGECGLLNNQRFGTVVPNTTFAPDVLVGWGKRVYNWQMGASVQQELRPGMAVNLGYFRTWFGNFTVTQNVLTTPADFNQFTINAPLDPRLPGGGGYPVVGYDVRPGLAGQVQNLVTQASHFGNQTEVYNGVDATFNWRFGQGGLFQGGTNVGRTVTHCVAPNAPNPYCDVETPWLSQVKLSGAYPLPVWGIGVSAVYQNLPGIIIGSTSASANVTATSAGFAGFTVTNAQVKASLGRDLAAGPNGTARVFLLAPNQLFEDRINQFDLRFTKTLQVGRGRVRASVDIYNLFNNASILSENGTFGANFKKPLETVGGRLLKFGGEFNF